MYLRIFLLGTLLLLSASGFAGSSIDSLEALLNSPMADTSKVKIHLKLCEKYCNKGEFQPGIMHAQNGLKLNQSLIRKGQYSDFTRPALIECYRILALSYENSDEYLKSIALFNKALQLAEKDKNELQKCIINGNLSMYYYNQGDYPSSLKYALEQLKLAEQLKNDKKIASAYNKIGIIYKRQMLHEKAIEYLDKSIRLYRILGDSSRVANGINNKGDVYYNQKKYKASYTAYQTQISILEPNDRYNLADAQKRVASVFTAVSNLSEDSIQAVFPEWQKDTKVPIKKMLLDSALHYFQKSYAYFQEINEYYEISDCLNLIGYAYQLQSNYPQAIQSFHSGYEIATKLGILEKAKSASFGLYETHRQTHQYKESLEWFLVYSNLKDSIFSTGKERELGRLESQNEFEKKEAEMKAEQERDRVLAEADKKRQRLVLWLVSIGLVLVILFSIFLFNRFKVTQKQKKTIEWQKKIVEEKNHEITGSIQYAKRIQNAILPPSKLVNENLKDHFILYQPKDIVAGDFYWLEAMPEQEKVFFTAADCTGHGVPGAMVSVMCSSALTKVVKEMEIFQPSVILDKTVEILEERFSHSEEDLKDGMDLALCSLDFKNRQLEYAGANNPLWIIRKNKKEESSAENQEELIEIRPDKQPVGKFTARKPFTNHVLKLEKGDLIYIFTDGFVDQFGGEKGKKYKAKAFKELLLSIYEMPMTRQKEIIFQTFEKWRGDLEQVDDICIIGVRI